MVTNTTLTLESVLQQSDDQVSTELDEEVILMSLEKGKYYGLNTALSAIWNMLETPTPISEICENLQKDYDVSKEQCETEVISILEELNEKNLIKEA